MYSEDFINKRLIELSFLAEQGEMDSVDANEEKMLQEMLDNKDTQQ